MMTIEQAQKMIRYAYSSMCDQFGLDELCKLQEFLDSYLDDDFLLTEFEDFVAAKLDAKLKSWIESAKKITREG